MNIVRHVSLLAGALTLIVTALLAVARHGESPPIWILYEGVWPTAQGIYRMNPDGSNQQRLTTGQDWGAAWSPRGDWIVYASRRGSGSDLYRMRPDGSDDQRLTDHPGDEYQPAWSPDGQWIVFAARSRADGVASLVKIRADGSGWQQLTDDTANDSLPAWSPDGAWIAFQSARHNYNLGRLPSDSTQAQWLTLAPGSVKPRHYFTPVWSADGRWILFLAQRDDGGSHICRMRADGSAQQCFTDAAPFAEYMPVWSPDGTGILALAWRRDRSGVLLRVPINGSPPAELAHLGQGFYGALAASPPETGWLAFEFQSSERDASQQIVRIRADGSARQVLTRDGEDYTGPEWSPPLVLSWRAGLSTLAGVALLSAGFWLRRGRRNNPANVGGAA